MISSRALAALLVVSSGAGCFAKLADSDQNNQTPDARVDAAPGIDADESEPDAEEPDAAEILPDAPRCAARQVVLQFQGQTLNPGPSDARTLTATWAGEANGGTQVTLPPYLQNNPDRQTVINSIIDRVRTHLAQFPIIVSTTPPPTGEYVLVVLGGTNAQAGTPYTWARNVLDCGDAQPNDVMWIADNTPIDKVDDYIVGGIAYGLGLGGTNDPGNCMCSWRNNCQQAAGDCTLSTAINAVNDVCTQTGNPQNQTAAFEAAFCQ